MSSPIYRYPPTASCGDVTYTTRPSPGAVTAPDGADAAVSAFRDSLNGTYPDPARDTGKGCSRSRGIRSRSSTRRTHR